MGYKPIITEKAEMQLDRILYYILEKLQNRQAAEASMEDIERTYAKLEYMAEAVQLCGDPFLAGKGYRKIALEQHNYVLLYQIEGEFVYINGIFHMLEKYWEKV